MKRTFIGLFVLLCLLGLVYLFMEDQTAPSEPLASSTVTKKRVISLDQRPQSTEKKDLSAKIQESAETKPEAAQKVIRAHVILEGFSEAATLDWTKKARVFLVQKDQAPLRALGSSATLTWRLPEDAQGLYEIALDRELQLSKEEPTQWFYNPNPSLNFALTQRHRIDAALPGLQELELRIRAPQGMTMIQAHVIDDLHGQDVEGATFTYKKNTTFDYFRSKTDQRGRANLWLESAENYEVIACSPSAVGSKPVRISKPIPNPVLFRIPNAPISDDQWLRDKQFLLNFQFGENNEYDELRIKLELVKDWEKQKDGKSDYQPPSTMSGRSKVRFEGKKGVYRVHLETRTREAKFELILDRRGVERFIDVQLERKNELRGSIYLSDGRLAKNALIFLHDKPDPSSIHPRHVFQPTENGRFKIYCHRSKNYLHVIEPSSEHFVRRLNFGETEISIQLKEGQSFDGRILDSKGQPIPSLPLSVLAGKEKVRRLETDRAGAFSMVGLKPSKTLFLETYGHHYLLGFPGVGTRNIPHIRWTIQAKSELQLRVPKAYDLGVTFNRKPEKGSWSASAFLLKQAKSYPNIQWVSRHCSQYDEKKQRLYGLLPGDYLVELIHHRDNGRSFGDAVSYWKSVRVSSVGSIQIPFEEPSSVKIVRKPEWQNKELSFELIPEPLKRASAANPRMLEDFESLGSEDMAGDEDSIVIEALGPGRYWLSWTDDEGALRGGQWVTVVPKQTEQVIQLR